MKYKNSKTAELKAMELLLYKNRSEKDLREKMATYEYTEEEIEKAIEYVRSYGYLNDRTYAEQYVMTKGSKMGKAALIYELKKQGIDELIISELVNFEEEDEKEKIRDQLIKRAGQPHHMEEKEYRRHFAYFMRRGFKSSEIHSVFSQYQKEEE